MAVALHAPITFAAEAAKLLQLLTAKQRSKMTIRNQLITGCLAGSLHGKLSKRTRKTGIKLDKDQLIAGVQDAFADKANSPTKRSNRLCKHSKLA